ncbi:MAG: DUF6597 domain-containing transcriptional factor [Stackebrandtia sp.]
MEQHSVYAERPVADRLRRWSHCAWVRQVPDSASRVPATRIVPDGCVDLVWAAGRLQAVGPDSEPRRVTVSAGDCFVGVRLRPGAARLLLGDTPASEVLNRQVDLAELWGSEVAVLADGIAGQEPWRAAARLTEALGARLHRYQPEAMVVAVAERLDQPRPPDMKTLAWDLGYSERQLRRRIVTATGYGPKTLEQILRFRRTLAAADGATVWARVAAEQGYADQAHLTRQVRRWSHLTPGRLSSQSS